MPEKERRAIIDDKTTLIEQKVGPSMNPKVTHPEQNNVVNQSPNSSGMFHRDQDNSRQKMVLLFDMDGTLCDSMGEWNRFDERLIAHYDLRSYPNFDVSLFPRMSLPEVSAYVSEILAAKVSPEDVYRTITNDMLIFYREKVELKPGILNLCQGLRDAGYSMSVATSTDYELAKTCLSRCGILPFFDTILSNDRVDANKGDTLFWQTASEFYQVDTKQMVLFDDAHFALQGAKNSGLKTVGILDIQPERRAERIKEVSDIFVRSLDDLSVEEWLERLFVLESEVNQ